MLVVGTVTTLRATGARSLLAVTTSATIGVLGRDWRAAVTGSGTIAPWDGSPALAWHVAADDRWHTPAAEPSVRQKRILGAPVFETRLRVPGGDAVQRVWSVATSGGCTVVELANESPLPVACALTRPDLLTSRPPTGVPIEGIDLAPATTIVLPIGHRAAVSVALAHDGRGPGPLPPGLPTPEATARGWVALAERASRLVLPDQRRWEGVVAARCEVLLVGPPSLIDDPVGYLLAVGELFRMGELGAGTSFVEDVATAVHAIASQPGWDVDAALAAAGVVLAGAGERRAVGDIARIAAGRAPMTVPSEALGIRAVAAVERRLAAGPVLVPDGIPDGWRGAGIEAHSLPIGPSSTLSFALRWHGEHPAILWEVVGEPVELSAPAIDPTWRTRAPSGEALWRHPPH